MRVAVCGRHILLYKMKVATFEGQMKTIEIADTLDRASAERRKFRIGVEILRKPSRREGFKHGRNACYGFV